MASQSQVAEVTNKVNALAAYKYGDASPASVKKLFLEYDADKNGLASKDEIKRLLDDAHVDLGTFIGNGMVAGAIIDEMDTNGDGQLSWDEYKTYTHIVEPAAPPVGGGDPGAGLPTYDQWVAAQKNGTGGGPSGPYAPGSMLGAPAASSSSGGSYWPWVLGLGGAAIVGRMLYMRSRR